MAGASMTPVGRPEIGTPINVRLGAELLARVDDFAYINGMRRAEAVRHLLADALDKRATA